MKFVSNMTDIHRHILSVDASQNNQQKDHQTETRTQLLTDLQQGI